MHNLFHLSREMLALYCCGMYHARYMRVYDAYMCKRTRTRARALSPSPSRRAHQHVFAGSMTAICVVQRELADKARRASESSSSSSSFVAPSLIVQLNRL